MNYELSEKGGVTFIKVLLQKATAEIKSDFESYLKKRIEEENVKKIALDLSGVSFVDSSFLGALVKGLKSISNNKGDIKVLGLQPSVRAMFELTRLYKVFEIFENENDLIRSY